MQRGSLQRALFAFVWLGTADYITLPLHITQTTADVEPKSSGSVIVVVVSKGSFAHLMFSEIFHESKSLNIF